jgi:hypothetical protein
VSCWCLPLGYLCSKAAYFHFDGLLKGISFTLTVTKQKINSTIYDAACRNDYITKETIIKKKTSVSIFLKNAVLQSQKWVHFETAIVAIKSELHSLLRQRHELPVELLSKDLIQAGLLGFYKGIWKSRLVD